MAAHRPRDDGLWIRRRAIRTVFVLRELETLRGGAVPAARGLSPLLGIALVALGVCASLWAAFEFRRGLVAVAAGESVVRRSALAPTLIAFALCSIGVATIWYFLMRW